MSDATVVQERFEIEVHFPWQREDVWQRTAVCYGENSDGKGFTSIDAALTYWDKISDGGSDLYSEAEARIVKATRINVTGVLPPKAKREGVPV